MSLIIAEYICPEHGRFEALVEREPNGDAPDVAPCPGHLRRYSDDEIVDSEPCALVAPYTISAPFGKVKAWEVVRGGWQKPERKTFLDTRKLGEGQSMEEFRADRKAVWETKRKEEVMRMKRE